MSEVGKPLRPIVNEMKSILLEKGITQSEVESKMEWSERFLSRLIHGHIELKMRHLFEFLEAVEVPPSDFFFRIYGDTSSSVRREEDKREIAQEVLAMLKAEEARSGRV